MIKFMKSLQELRSACSAHRKGRKYEKVKKEFNLKDNFKDTFENILIGCIKIINTLSNQQYKLI